VLLYTLGMAKALETLREVRIEKLQKLKDKGINPYPSKIKLGGKLVNINQARDLMGKEVLVAGRIWSTREHGAVIFMDLKDDSGVIQILFQKKILGEDFSTLDLFDTGDFLAVKGKIIKTQSGEITVDATYFQLLSKSIRPIPSTWFGLKDEEERYRQRYVDLLLNDELKDTFKKKAVFWQSMREFMVDKGFLEVETPVLENTAGGADANPFATHHNALDIDLYLRISMGELWQKRLMVAGFGKTFEIGRQFRNEGVSREHLQDYTQMEFYWSYANYEDTMDLVEEMYKHVAQKTFGKLTFGIDGHEIDLGKPWEKIDYKQTLIDETGIDISKVTEDDLRKELSERKIEFDKNETKGRLIDSLWKSVRKNVPGPVFLTGHPVEVSPLAKRMEGNPEYVERYQVIIAGSELGNGYSELNDPIDQAKRFAEQQKMREKGDTEAQMEDDDFVRALEYGMPPTSGFGVSERLFSFLAGKPIRETVLFPLLRPEDGKKVKTDV
jgi:lysyl-tRNA synthetase class 2